MNETISFSSFGENVGKENRKTLVEITLRGFPVPRPAFEIIKVGKMWVKRKMQKNTAI